MEPRRRRIIRGETHPPTRRDRLIVLIVSLGFFVFLLPMAQLFHASPAGWIVVVVVIGLPVVTINVLLPFSRWEPHHSKEPPRN